MFDTNKVKEELKLRKISQLELSKIIELPYSTLNDKMNNKTKFTVDEAYKIAKFLNKKIEDFYN